MKQDTAAPEDGSGRRRKSRSDRAHADRVSDWVQDQVGWTNSSPMVDDSDRYEDETDADDPEGRSEAAEGPPGPAPRDGPFKYAKEVYVMRCEWSECGFQCSKVEEFVRHVAGHVPHAEQGEGELKETLYCCLWEACGFDCPNWFETLRHVNYHAYHTKLKAIGAVTLKRVKLPDCMLDYAGRNLLPVLATEFTCEWDNCDLMSNNFQQYLYHVQSHVHMVPRTTSQSYVCLWRDCNKSCRQGGKLREHVRMHTQERMIGCPICGGTYTSKSKFFDHCKRQISHNKREFKCSYCRRNYPSEALLRVHIRMHVNLHKCPMCDMTCPYPSTLCQHIRYRHIELKPFHCNLCTHQSKSQRDLEHHQLTHCAENFWVCEREGCDFECRSKEVLQRHILKRHHGDDNLYTCHICTNKYPRGSDLTRHLKEEHSYRWAAGHTRFKYLRYEDGLYRLQTVRYESIEVAQEMMKPRTGEPATKKYKCIAETPQSLLICEEVEEEEEGGEEEEEGGEGRTEAENNKGLTSFDSDHSDDSKFGESLKKHLGLTDDASFIEVVKTNNMHMSSLSDS